MLICYAIFAAIAVLFHVTAIFIMVKTRAYVLFHHRLTLYLTIGGILCTVAYTLQVLPVDIGMPETHPVSLRQGWEGVCVLGGFMAQYAPLFQTFTVVWTSCVVLAQVLNPNLYDQIALKHEIAGVTTSILAPLVFTWVPFITDSYGLSETRCWLIDNNCHDLLKVYLIVVNIVPNLLLSLLGLSLIGGAIIVLLRKVTIGNLERFFRIAMKENLPLALYPTVHMLILFSRLVTTLSRMKYSLDLVGVAFMIMFQLSSCILPLSLLLRPSVRRTLCRSKKVREKEMLIGSCE